MDCSPGTKLNQLWCCLLPLAQHCHPDRSAAKPSAVQGPASAISTGLAFHIPRISRTAHSHPGWGSPRQSPQQQVPPPTELQTLVSALSYKLQKRKNVKPYQSHEVPVPGGHVDHDAPVFDRLVTQRRGAGIKQDQQASRQVKSMGPRKHISHGTARAGGEIESAIPQLAPGHPLSSQEGQPKGNGYAEP